MTDTSHIPYRYLQDPALYRVEQQRIFQGPTWHYLCLEAELPQQGSFVTTQIGETPVVVVRGDGGSVRVMINRCRHKGALVCVEPRGQAATLRCLYHGWSYHLDGRQMHFIFDLIRFLNVDMFIPVLIEASVKLS